MIFKIRNIDNGLYLDGIKLDKWDDKGHSFKTPAKALAAVEKGELATKFPVEIVEFQIEEKTSYKITTVYKSAK